MEVYCTNSAVWAVWRVRDGDLEDTLIQHLMGGPCMHA